MSAATTSTLLRHDLPTWIDGEEVSGMGRFAVHYPYTGEVIGSAPRLSRAEVGSVLDQAVTRRFDLSRYELISLTGGTEIGQRVAREMGYRRAILELGGNDPLLVPRVPGLDAAIATANQQDFGLSSGVVTNHLRAINRCIREPRAGSVNIREVPGYRTELTPFGGAKDSGLGVKEGVIEAMKAMTFTKVYTLPWD